MKADLVAASGWSNAIQLYSNNSRQWCKSFSKLTVPHTTHNNSQSTFMLCGCYHKTYGVSTCHSHWYLYDNYYAWHPQHNLKVSWHSTCQPFTCILTSSFNLAFLKSNVSSWALPLHTTWQEGIHVNRLIPIQIRYHIFVPPKVSHPQTRD